MGGADDIINRAFGKESQIKKLENFEVSTLKLVLRQLGWTAAEVAAKANELGAGFGWDWFNGENFMVWHLGSTREFRFNFWELLTKPMHNPISQAFREFSKGLVTPGCMIFHVYDHGRWVAISRDIELREPHVHVTTDGFGFNVLPFAQFFNRWKPE